MLSATPNTSISTTGIWREKTARNGLLFGLLVSPRKRDCASSLELAIKPVSVWRANKKKKILGHFVTTFANVKHKQHTWITHLYSTTSTAHYQTPQPHIQPRPASPSPHTKPPHKISTQHQHSIIILSNTTPSPTPFSLHHSPLHHTHRPITNP